MNAVLSVPLLLAPIAGENPAGNDGRSISGSRYQICKAARNSARAAERSELFDGGGEGAVEAWREVAALAPQILAEDSKDLEVASWYAEALVRRSGFSGLADAFEIICGLIENFWKDIYPRPDEDGLETQLAPLAGLNGEGAEGVLIPPIRNLVITDGAAAGPFSYWDYRQAAEADRIVDEKARTKRLQQLGFELTTIDKAIAESSLDFLLQLRADIERCQTQYLRLNQLLEATVGVMNAPPSSNILNILQEVSGAVEHLGRGRWPAPVAPEPIAEISAETGDGAAATASAGAATSRAQAFQQLRSLADYFRQHEPHSPVAYLLDKAVNWGQLPLHELLDELIPDNSARQHFSLVTGIGKTGA